MTCPGCGRANRDDRRFCGGCGVALAWPCGRCGFGNGEADRFCGGCGAPLATGAPGGGARAAPPAQSARPAPEGMLSAQEVSALLEGEEKEPAPSLPPRITQDDLDRLFEGRT
jgi:hypothetical protein